MAVETQQNRENSSNVSNSSRKRPRRDNSTGANEDKQKSPGFVKRSTRGGKPLSNHSCISECETLYRETEI